MEYIEIWTASELLASSTRATCLYWCHEIQCVYLTTNAGLNTATGSVCLSIDDGRTVNTLQWN